jgi:hypothetical protein
MNIKLVSPATTLSITLSLRDWNMNTEIIRKATPKIALAMAKIGFPPIFAFMTLSKFSLISPTRSSPNSSTS